MIFFFAVNSILMKTLNNDVKDQIIFYESFVVLECQGSWQ